MADLETLAGNFENAFSQAEPTSIQHAFEITNERRTNNELRNKWFWTADFPMYRLEDDKGNQSSNGEAVLYFAPREHNLVFQNIEDAVKQIRSTNNYVPTLDGINQVVESAKTGITLKVKLSELGLIKDNDEWSHFDINTGDYSKLNDSQKALAERVYGKGEDFATNMKMLSDPKGNNSNDGIHITKVCVLNPEYVKDKARDKALGRVSALYYFDDISNFVAGGRGMDDYDGFRGVRKSAEGARPENDGVADAYKTLIENPDRIKPEMYAGLSGLVSNYLAKTIKQ